MSEHWPWKSETETECGHRLSMLQNRFEGVQCVACGVSLTAQEVLLRANQARSPAAPDASEKSG